MEGVRLKGRTAVVTGANSGIGRETSRELAARGARVIMACRNMARAEETRQDIITSTGHTDIHVQLLDLASFSSIREFAENFNKTESRLDLLINNAGVLTKERATTKDGNEMMFGVNHLGHFLLTYLLLDKLKCSAPSRVVILSSKGHELSMVDFSDLQSLNSFSWVKTYSRSKTANVLFATHLAKVLDGTGVSVYSLHPGIVETELAREIEGHWQQSCFVFMWKHCMCRKILTSAEGAQTSLYCALEPSIATHSGRYYSDKKEVRAKSYATNHDNAKRLWDVSLQLCGLQSKS